MAYTKIKNIKTTVNKAINYIVNDKKTNQGQFVYGYKVTPQTSSIEFEFTEKMAKDIKGDYKRDNGNIAYHIIQSFDYKDIITPEEALEIGKKTAEEFTEGKFEYVIATHIDKTCVHNHIIFNAVSFVDYKRFDSKPYKTVAKLRAISDKICLDNGLSILKEQKNDSKSYYEWTMEKQGLSWKKTLKNIIDKNIVIANNFEEFLNLMQENNYEIKRGKYIAFRYLGQERFIRAYKLGVDYSEEKIKERINVTDKKLKLNTNKVVVKKPLPMSVWIKIKSRKQAVKNIKEIAELLNKLENDYNIVSFKDVKIEKGLTSSLYNKNKKEVINIENKIKEIQEEQRNILIYMKYKEINNSYQKSINKKKFYLKHESELILFESARKNIESENQEFLEDKKIKNEKEIKNLQEEYIKNRKTLKSYKEKIDVIEKLERKIDTVKEKEKKQKMKKRNIIL